MREGLAAVVHIAAGVVIQQHNRFCLACLSQSFNDVHGLMFEHPPIGGQVNLLACFDVAQQFLAIYAFAVSERPTESAYASFDIFHGVVPKQVNVYICSFKHFQSLPNGFDAGGSHAFGKWYGYVVMWIKGTESAQAVCGLTGNVGQNCAGKLFQQGFLLL